MSQPVLDTGRVALLGSDGRLLDTQIPPALLQATADTEVALQQAIVARDQAVAAAAQASGGANAAAAAAAAEASRLAAVAAQVAAESARDAAVAAGGGGASQGAIDGAIANLGKTARTNSYTDLDNKPDIPDAAADVGAVALASVNAAFGVPGLDSLKRLQYATAAPGSRFDIICGNIPGGATYDAQPLRSTLSNRTDIYFRYFKRSEISRATGYAITLDSWVRWSG